MNYLSAENIAKSFNEKWLFQNITIGINQGQKIALVGANGTGKSTMFKILVGKMQSDGGSVVINKNIRATYLDQDPDFDGDLTVMQALFVGENESQKAIAEYERCLQNPEDGDAFQKAMERMDLLKAWDYEQKVKTIVTKLGVIDFEQKVNTLSGGQKKRLALAKVLIEEPDLLMLDEPTNHLDLETIEWLENILSTSAMTLLLITHDRYFLDSVATEIIELDNGEIFKYKGNYSYFLEKKEERQQQEAASIDKAKNTYRKELDWMRRQPKARGTKAKYRVDAFAELDKKAHSARSDEKLSLQVITARQGNKVLELHNVSKAFGSSKFIDDFSYIFKKKDRIGVIGKNGIGKSTLLNMLTGSLKPDTGEVIKGETTKVGYYSQTGLAIKEDMRVIDVLKDVAEIITLADGSTVSVSKLLELFLFNATKQYTFISKLSGGEKKRLNLLKVLITNPNFLILDEPTNDLDIVTLNVLEDFLEQFPGCLMIVSHDRYFMDRLVDHIFIFEGDGQIRDFPGNYTDYREWLKENDQEKLKEPAINKNMAPAAVSSSSTSSDKKKMSFNEKKEYETLEKEIEKLENEKADLIAKLNAGSGNHAELAEWSKKISALEKELDTKSSRWLELADKA
jgi:ATP-binding cassette subfamily F protein uup